MTIDKQKLKALAEAQPVQVWKRTRGQKPEMKGQPLMYGVDGPEVVSDWEDWGFTGKAAEYIAAASPATVLALLAEIERIGADRKACWEEFKVQGRQLDQLKAENETLRSAALAAREFIMHEAEIRGLLDENNEVSHRHPRRQAAIASIDAAMAKEASHG